MTDAYALAEAIRGHSLASRAAMRNTIALARRVHAEGIPGDLVECGIFCGVQIALMAAVLGEAGDTTRMVHGFDSFQGIPEAGPRDDTWPGLGDRLGVQRAGRLISTGVAVNSLTDVLAHLDAWKVDRSRVALHEGWFQDTLPAQAPKRIALLRLDADLYESTRVCLEALYPRVSPGGYVIADDWALTGCRDAITEYLSGLSHGEHLPEFREVLGGNGERWWQVEA